MPAMWRGIMRTRFITGAAVAGLAVVTTSAGCVRRTLTINTDPQGAVVWLNGEEVGKTPVTTDFLWYGDYEVIARKPGYQTLISHYLINEPVYELPGIDLLSEVFYPGHIVDARTTTLALSPEALPSSDTLLANAAELRERALAIESPKRATPAEARPQPAETKPAAEMETITLEPEVEPAKPELQPSAPAETPPKPAPQQTAPAKPAATPQPAPPAPAGPQPQRMEMQPIGPKAANPPK